MRDSIANILNDQENNQKFHKFFQSKFNWWRKFCIRQILMHFRFAGLAFEVHWYSDYIKISIIMGCHTTYHNWLLQSWRFMTNTQVNGLLYFAEYSYIFSKLTNDLTILKLIIRKKYIESICLLLNCDDLNVIIQMISIVPISSFIYLISHRIIYGPWRCCIIL